MRPCPLLLTCILAFTANVAYAGSAYAPPRLAGGRPDFQGVWDHVNATPLERPPGFTTLAISAEQAVALEQLILKFAEDRSTPTEPTEYFKERHVLPIRGVSRSSTSWIRPTAEFQARRPSRPGRCGHAPPW